MKKAILYIHGKGGSHLESEEYRKNCAGFDMTGVDYTGSFPWIVQNQMREAYDAAFKKYTRIFIIANSIGAYFAMHSLQKCEIEKALFISPVLDMERLILDMMQWAHVTERELCEKGEIPTDFGETLSWEYLNFVREHPVKWDVPTEILYGEKDRLTSRETVDTFVKSHRSTLTIMKNGEHWFHTNEQMAFLDDWMKKAISRTL